MSNSVTPHYYALIKAMAAVNIEELFNEIDEIAKTDPNRALVILDEMSRNTETERQLVEIRLRGERNAKRLLRSINKNRSTARCE